jgi:hypothetical protein
MSTRTRKSIWYSFCVSTHTRIVTQVLALKTSTRTNKYEWALREIPRVLILVSKTR